MGRLEHRENSLARDVGGMGEGVLRQWAREVGIVLNKSADHDATGWDFILEWPLEHETRSLETPIDLAPSPLRCIIQVKSTDRRIRGLQIELSNWLYLIRNPLPSFFLVLEFFHQSQCQNAYLIHIDAGYIAKVQRRLREISTQAKRPQLNRKKIRFTWNKNNALPSLDGPGLQTAILKHLPDGIDTYTRRKEESCASVGYEAGSGEFRFITTFPADLDIDQHLVDLDLGLITELEVEGGEFLDRRFDIPVSIKKFGAGKIQLIPLEPPSRGQLVITGGQRLTLDCDVVTPTGFGKFAAPESLRVKFVSGEWIFIIPLGAQNSMGLTYHPFQDSEECQLSVLQQSAKLILMVEDVFQNRTRLSLHAYINGSKLSSAKLEIKNPVPPPLLRWANLVHDAWMLARHFGVEREVKLVVGSLAREYFRTTLASSFITNYSRRLRLTFWIAQSWYRRQARCCIPFPFEARLGPYFVQLAVALFGAPTPTEKIQNDQMQVDFLVNEIQVCYEHLYDPQEETGKTRDELVEIVSQRYKDEMEVIHLKD